MLLLRLSLGCTLAFWEAPKRGGKRDADGTYLPLLSAELPFPSFMLTAKFSVLIYVDV